MISDYYQPPTVVTTPLPNVTVVEATDSAFWKAILADQQGTFDTADGGRAFAAYCRCDAGPHWAVWLDEGKEHRGEGNEADRD